MNIREEIHYPQICHVLFHLCNSCQYTVMITITLA